MKIVVLGANGMVGFELSRSLLALGNVVRLGRDDVDLANLDALRTALRREPASVIVNAAAYTNVDHAETDRRTADCVNGEAVGVIADEATRAGSLLVHYSTDYVFDGEKDGLWTEDDAPSPVNAYGASKLLGERALAASRADWLCVRTSWVYASRGRNFVRTILRLAQERDELRVVADQFGAPTSARMLADVTAHLVVRALEERRGGRFEPTLLHYCAAGETTWHGIATEALAMARDILPDRAWCTTEVVPIATIDFPTPARRPHNSRLSMNRIFSRFGLVAPDWRVALRRCIEELA